MAKAVLNLPTTRMLIKHVEANTTLRRLCGWSRLSEVPSEATFSRAFAEFADRALPSRLRGRTLIRKTHGDRLVGHITRDSTAIEGHEKPQRAEKPEPSALKQKPRKRGRPRKGERPRPSRPAGWNAPQPICPSTVTSASNATPRDIRRHGSAISCISTPRTATFPSVAFSPRLPSTTVRSGIPLATMTTCGVVNLYDLMDSAYDAAEIQAHRRALGHVPIIDVNPRRDACP